MQSNCDDFFHAVLDHRGCEEVGLSLALHRNFPHILQENGTEGLSGLGHVNGPTVPHHLGHEREGPTVVQVKVADDDAVQVLGQITVCYV